MGRQVLLIEDSATDARLVRAAVAGSRHECDLEHAADLGQGLDRLRLAGIDLVLLDLHLPGSQGLETLRSVRSLAPDVPVIVVTGSEDETLADRALRQGAEDLVVKGSPHFVPLLRRAVRQALERIQVLEALGGAAAPPAASALARAA